MALTPEQLQKYLDSNPEAMAKFKSELATKAKSDPELAARLAEAQPKLSTGLSAPEGSLANNYSIGAGLRAKQHLDMATGVSTWTDPRTGEIIEDYVPGSILEGTGGVVYVGNDPNGDTEEGREAFRQWVTSSSRGNIDGSNVSFADQYYGDANQRWQWSDPRFNPGMLTGDNTESPSDPKAGPGTDPATQTTGQADPWDPKNWTPDQNQTFFNNTMGMLYSGDLTADQLASIDRSTLTQSQRAAYDASMRALNGYDAIVSGTGKLTDEDIGEFVRGMYNLETRSPEQFATLIQSNPELAVKYFASMGTGRYMTGQDIDPKQYRQYAEMVGYQMGVDAGYGEDGKQDGKSFVSGYNSNWSDVNSEGGRADFMKLGRPGAMRGGFGDFVEDNPWQVVATVASVFVPMAAPAIATTLGVSNAVASGIISAGLSAVQGGDLKDVLVAGLTSYGMGEMVDQLPAIMESISPEAAQSFAELQTAAETGKDVVEGGQGIISPGGMLKAGGEVIDQARDYADGVDVQRGIEWQPHDTSDVLGDVQVQVPDYSLEKPESDGGSGGDTASGGQTSAIERTPVEESGGGTQDDPGLVTNNPREIDAQVPPEWADVDITTNRVGVEAWRHTNPDGQVVAGDGKGNIWEVGDDDVQDPNDWEAGLVLGPTWPSGTEVSQGTGYEGTGSNGTGSTGDGNGNTGDGTTNTGGTGGGTGNTDGSTNGDGTGDGEGDGSGDGPGLGSFAGGLFAGAGGADDYEDFMYRLKFEFPQTAAQKIPAKDLLRIFEETVNK